jgi:hypothetical protein
MEKRRRTRQRTLAGLIGSRRSLRRFGDCWHETKTTTRMLRPRIPHPRDNHQFGEVLLQDGDAAGEIFLTIGVMDDLSRGSCGRLPLPTRPGRKTSRFSFDAARARDPKRPPPSDATDPYIPTFGLGCPQLDPVGGPPQIVAAGLEVDAPAVRRRRYLRAMRLAALVAAMLLVPVSAASALEMGGDAKPRHWNWARAAAVNVPLPDARIVLMSGHDPEYLPEFKMLLLPAVGHGRYQESYRSERYLFLHELGHVYDYTALRPADRARFKRAVGTTCAWRAAQCRSWNWWNETVVSVPPQEMYAEVYAACAIGLTRVQADEAAYPSYGWMPPQSVDQAGLCGLLRAR